MSTEAPSMNLKEQIDEAVKNVDNLFRNLPDMPPLPDVVFTDPPEGATVKSLWRELEQTRALAGELHLELCQKRGLIKKPKIQDAIKLLLENPELASIPIPLVADIIKSAYKSRGITTSTSESSVRWYISRMTMEWDIKPRRDPKPIRERD